MLAVEAVALLILVAQVALAVLAAVELVRQQQSLAWLEPLTLVVVAVVQRQITEHQARVVPVL
jgi:hypothetical protein